MSAAIDLSLLKNVHMRNGKTIARCPACAESGTDEKGEHLFITAGGKFGCVMFPNADGNDHRKRIFALAGIVEKDTARAPARKARTWPDAESAAQACMPKGYTLAAVYHYPKECKPFAAVARYEGGEGKTFRQYHLNSDGWLPGAPSTAWPLYGVEALSESGAVYIVEGEKAQAAAVSIGVSALTSAGGSKAAAKTDWQPLAGRDVVILPDNDKPGEAYAADVSQILAGLNPPARVRVVRLPGLPEGGDIADFLDTRDAVEPETLRTEIEGLAAKAAQPGLQTVNAADWLTEELPPLDCILADTFELGDKATVIGSSKRRKTFFVIQLGLSLTAGRDFLNWRVCKRRRVLIVQYEIRAKHFHRRVKRLAESLGIRPGDLGDRLQIINGRGTTVDLQAIGETVKRLNIEVVIFDPLFKMLSGDENKAADVKPILAAFDRLAEDTGAAVLYVHHDSKGTAGDRDIRDRGAGSNVLGRDYDAAFTLTEARDDADAVVVQTLLRNFAPQPAITVQWQNGAFVVSDLPPIARTSADRPSKYAGAIRGILAKEPAISDSALAERVGCDRSTAYRIRKRVA